MYFLNVFAKPHDPTYHDDEANAYREVMLELSDQGYGREYLETIKVDRMKATVLDYRQEAATEILRERNFERELRGMGPVPLPRDPALMED